MVTDSRVSEKSRNSYCLNRFVWYMLMTRSLGRGSSTTSYKLMASRFVREPCGVFAASTRFSWLRKKKRRGNVSVELPAADDLLQREFNADEINKVWVTEIIEHPTCEVKCILSYQGSVCSKIVGAVARPWMKAKLAVNVLHDVMRKRAI